MKIKYQIILLLTAMVMLFGGCGKKNTVVTGRYYYPDQEKDAKTEETSDDADESAETTEENEAVIGSDQFLIKTNDMAGGRPDVMSRLHPGKSMCIITHLRPGFSINTETALQCLILSRAE